MTRSRSERYFMLGHPGSGAALDRDVLTFVPVGCHQDTAVDLADAGPRLALLAALLPMLLMTPHARADADDTVKVTVGATVVHDDNLFRLSSSADPNVVLGKPTKGDDITISSLALKLNKPYSLQRFELEASLVDYRYRTFDYLNFTALNYAAAWRWSVTPFLHGNLTSDRAQTLNSFSDFTGYGTRNLRTDENTRFDGVFEVSGSWRLLGGLAQSTRTNSQLFVQEGDTRLNTVEGGLRYDFRSGSSLSLVARDGRGVYFNRPQPLSFPSLFDNRFDQRENEVRLFWPVTGKTFIDARAAHVSRTHANFGERDYAGNVGNVNVIWNVTGKTVLTATVAHELNSYQFAANSAPPLGTTSYVSIDRFALGALWQVSAKTALRGRYDYAQRNYRGAIAPSPFNDRVDTLRSTLLALEWQPLRTLLLSTSLQNDRRAANEPGLDFASTALRLTAQISF